MEKLYNLLDEFEEARRNAYVDAIYLKSQGRRVAGIFGRNIPREILWALDITPVNVYSIDDSNIAASHEAIDANSCSLIKASYGYTVTERCPLIYSADIIIGNDMCPHKTSMLSKLSTLKDTYIIKNCNNAPDLESEYRKFVKFMENKFSVRLDEDRLTDAIKKLNFISNITTDIVCIYMAMKCPINVCDLHNIVYGSQFILDLDERYAKLSEMYNILKEASDSDMSNKNKDSETILITGAPLAGLTEEILKPLSQKDNVFAVFTPSLCEGENTSITELNINPYIALANKYVSNCDPLVENYKNISQIIDIRLLGCDILPEPNHNLPGSSLTVNYGENIDEFKVFPKQ